ncbi:MAG: hypothetical protein FJW23_12170 [Acidimicrobiia bacterium]|nr:hypothetical protein [Acidimicrobiia bacterium]
MTGRPASSSPRDGDPGRERAARDADARRHAVDPSANVALLASAGTGKTRVLVDRYVNLLRSGVDPANVLAITFTRKAAAEMRERVVASLRRAATEGNLPAERWRGLRDRLGEVSISTIDAFCHALLREFPLEADLDPAFRLADDTEVPRLVEVSLDRATRVARSLSRTDAEVALVLAELGERRLRDGLAALLARRLVVDGLLNRYLSAFPSSLTAAIVERAAWSRLERLFAAMPGGLEAFLDSGPLVPAFGLLARDLRRVAAATASQQPEGEPASPLGAVMARVAEHFLTQAGTPRRQLAYVKAEFATASDFRLHRALVVDHAAVVGRAIDAWRREVNALLARGVQRIYRIALTEYRRTLDAHAALDFPDLLARALDLVRQMDEFAQSRFRLESRYHHILVDEMQDTSRAQWELISLLVRSWGEGAGVADLGPLPPSIFIVGDPKQSIYAFRDADTGMLDDAGRFLERLRPGGRVRHSISRSFRSVPGLLSFVNDVSAGMAADGERADAFRYGDEDRFPLVEEPADEQVLGLAAADSAEACAERMADEVRRLIGRAVVRDRHTGVARTVTPRDIAMLFRTRDSHRELEQALEARGVPVYVSNGLGFFDADEIKDLLALVAFLAQPESDLRAAAWLRSRLVGVSDDALAALAPRIARSVIEAPVPAALAMLGEEDRRLIERARTAAGRWVPLIDRLPPSELIDRVLGESAYAVELRGARTSQARENLNKLRGMVRRMQNRGSLTMGRLAASIQRLSLGDESNAAVDAGDSVSLMTVHAAKGLEFPIVFLVDLARGTGRRREAIRIAGGPGDAADVSVAVGDFQSDADADLAARDREESKRLLYVALTRARDLLYLAAVVKDGVVRPARGSLAEVLPPSLLGLFPLAATCTPGHGPLMWRATSGTAHQFRLCARDGSIGGPGLADGVEPGAGAVADDFRALAATPRTLPVVTPDPGGAGHARSGIEPDRIAGALVHRLIERFGLDAALDEATVSRWQEELLGPDEAPGVDRVQLARRAVRAYRAVSQREDVRACLARGVAFHEVPVTVSIDGGRRRGRIDCLVRAADGGITLLEFKCGRPGAQDQRQVEAYREAARRLFPEAPVDALLVYAGDAIDAGREPPDAIDSLKKQR